MFREPLSFERDAGMTQVEAFAEIESWHEANPEPSGYQLAERMFWRYARLHSDEPDRFGEALWNGWVGEMITLEQAARLAIPLADEVFGDLPEGRARFGEWVKQWFIERGLDRKTAAGFVASRAAS